MCFAKKKILKHFAIFIGHLSWSLFQKGQQLYQKETQRLVFSCKICKILKNIYFEVHLRMMAAIAT